MNDRSRAVYSTEQTLFLAVNKQPGTNIVAEYCTICASETLWKSDGKAVLSPARSMVSSR